MINHSYSGFHSSSWVEAAAKCAQCGLPYVLVTVIGTRGSTPRATGTKMVITETDIYDTLGGGQMEFDVITRARDYLREGKDNIVVDHIHLAANAGQCCGGAVSVLFETMVSQVMYLDVYGAGHVAHALMKILADLPVRIRWIDSRAEMFPEMLPKNVIKVVAEDPVTQLDLAPDNSDFLILTHNHQLDFLLAKAALTKKPNSWIGVIGSQTKAKRFVYRLKKEGVNDAALANLQCPVGLVQVEGKRPMEVAVSISGQLIQRYQSRVGLSSSGVSSKQLRSIENDSLLMAAQDDTQLKASKEEKTQ